jgi:hypothetical protein
MNKYVQTHWRETTFPEQYAKHCILHILLSGHSTSYLQEFIVEKKVMGIERLERLQVHYYIRAQSWVLDSYLDSIPGCRYHDSETAISGYIAFKGGFSHDPLISHN